MPRKVMMVQRKQCEPKTPAQLLNEHIEALDLTTPQEYVKWCRCQGFPEHLEKSARQRSVERSHARQLQLKQLEARIATRRQAHRDPAKLIELILSGKVEQRDLNQPAMLALHQHCEMMEKRKHKLNKLRDGLVYLANVSDLIDVGTVAAHLPPSPHNTFLGVLITILHSAETPIRSLHDWRPTTHNRHRQLHALLRHLYAHWPIPDFMDAAWCQGDTAETREYQHWYAHLGKGDNIRHLDLPIPYTKRMAHFFMTAPHDCSIRHALRWGQVLALGGSPIQARAIIASRLGESFEEHEFWTTVIQFFSEHPMLDPFQISPIVDYIFDRKFGRRTRQTGPGIFETTGPEQPEFSMRGRTPESLLRQVQTWHRRLIGMGGNANADWPGSQLLPFEFIEGTVGNQTMWTITELRSSKALLNEGRVMKHCVASYEQSCVAGRCSIWTMESLSTGGVTKHLTLEVRDKMICQARGKANRIPKPAERAIMHRWASSANLGIARFV